MKFTTRNLQGAPRNRRAFFIFYSGEFPRLASFGARDYSRFVRSGKPARKLVTPEQLYMSAQRALMRHPYSVHEMKTHLERRAEHKEHVPPIIVRLRELNYLDDAKYALNFAAQHARLRRQGKFRIARDLRTKGVPDRYIDEALASVFAENDEATLVKERIKRKLAHLRGPLEQKKLASLYRNLLTAGFSSEIIRAELKGITRGDIPELPDAEAASEE
jgi:regulatory protein